MILSLESSTPLESSALNISKVLLFSLDPNILRSGIQDILVINSGNFGEITDEEKKFQLVYAQYDENGNAILLPYDFVASGLTAEVGSGSLGVDYVLDSTFKVTYKYATASFVDSITGVGDITSLQSGVYDNSMSGGEEISGTQVNESKANKLFSGGIYGVILEIEWTGDAISAGTVRAIFKGVFTFRQIARQT